MGMRLIDADAFDRMLIEAQAKCKKDGGNFRFGVLGNVRGNLALFPTVDRPELVRCKDCVHFVPENAEEGDSSGHCRNRFAPCENQTVDMWWFCADGERDS